MSNFKLRLSLPWSDASGIMLRIADQCESLIVYEHSLDCSRPHIHALVWGSTRGYDTLSTWLKKLCPARSDRSLGTTYGKDKKLIDFGFISYMSKGTYDPVYVKGITQDAIAERKANGYIQEGGKDVVDVQAEQTKLLRKMSPTKKLQIEMLEEMRAEIGDVDYDSLTDVYVYNVIRKVCMRNHYYLPRGLYKLMEFRDNLMLYGNASAASNEFAIAIARRSRI